MSIQESHVYYHRLRPDIELVYASGSRDGVRLVILVPEEEAEAVAAMMGVDPGDGEVDRGGWRSPQTVVPTKEAEALLDHLSRPEAAAVITHGRRGDECRLVVLEALQGSERLYGEDGQLTDLDGLRRRVNAKGGTPGLNTQGG